MLRLKEEETLSLGQNFSSIKYAAEGKLYLNGIVHFCTVLQ